MLGAKYGMLIPICEKADCNVFVSVEFSGRFFNIPVMEPWPGHKNNFLTVSLVPLSDVPCP